MKFHSQEALELYKLAMDALSAARVALDQYNESASELYFLGYDFPDAFAFRMMTRDGDDITIGEIDLPEILEAGPVRRKFTRSQLLDILGRKSKWTCPYCQISGDKDFGPDGRVWHLDHGYPKALGGDDGNDNMILACATCNIRKGKKTATEVLRRVLRGDVQ